MYEQYFNLNPFTGEKYPISIYHNQPTLKVIPGVGVPRHTIGQMVLSQAVFPDDVRLPNMAYMKFTTCPYSHAIVTSIDTSKAKALPGVIAVITNADVPNMVIRAPCYALEKEVFISGDAVAAVVAEEEDIAEEAALLVNVQYNVLPFVLHAEDALASGAPVIYGTTNELGSPYLVQRGDIQAGLAAADVVVQDTYESKNGYGGTVSRSHTEIESETACAVWDGSGRVHAWTFNQRPHNEAWSIAAALGLPRTKVREEAYFTGYCGGDKGATRQANYLTAYMAGQLGRPVKCKVGNEFMYNCGGNQSTQTITMQVGCKKDGTITAIKSNDLCDGGNTGSRSSNGSLEILARLVNCPNVYLEGHDAFTNTNRAGSPRCIQHPRASWVINQIFDRTAEAVNMNPADWWLKNIHTASGVGGDQDNPKYDIGANPMPGMLNKLIQDSNWRTKWQGWKTPMSVNGTKYSGIGMAVHVDIHGQLNNPQTATIKVNDDGTFQVDCGTGDFGQGFRSVAQCIAAEELGVTADKVFVCQIDTDITQLSKDPNGSMGTRGSGAALILAARDVKSQLFTLAIAKKLIAGATDPTQLETTGNNIYLKSNPATTVPIATVCAQQQSTYIDSAPTGGGMIIGRGAHATLGTQSYQFASCVSEVTVDITTGEYSVTNVTNVHDAGRVLWQEGCNTQGIGAQIDSLGRGCMEGLIRDQATGIPLNPNLLDYKMPTHMDIPNINMEFYESMEPYGPFGQRGISEPMVNCLAASVANAVYNAVGARCKNSPITPASILNALGKG